MFRNWKANNAKRADFNGEILTIPKSKDGYLRKFKLYGKSVQDGEPTPDNPVEIKTVPSELDITSCGRNLTAQNEFTLAGNSKLLLQNTPFPVLRLSFDFNCTDITGTLTASSISCTTADDTVNHWSGAVLYGDKAEVIGNGWFSTTVLFGATTNNYTVRNSRVATNGLPIKEINFTNFIGFEGQIKNVMVSVGEVNEEFVPYQGETKTIQIKDNRGLGADSLHELCSLPDGTRDEVDLDSGKIIKRTAIKVFDGAESGWVKSASALNGFFISWEGHFSPEGTVLAPFFSNIVTPVTSVSDYLNFFNKGYSDGSCCISADPSIVGGTLESWKNWLAQQYANSTPVVVVYKRATPKIYDLRPDEQKKIITVDSDKAYIYTNAEVQPELSVNAISYGEE